MKVVMVILLACAAVLVHGRPALEEEQQPQRNVTTYGQIFGHAYIGALNILRQWLSTTTEVPTTITTEVPTTTTTEVPTTTTTEKLKEEDEKAELAHLKTLQLEYDVMEGHISTPKASQSILEALGNVFKTVWPYLPLSILVLVIIASIVVHVRQKKRRQADFLHEDLDSVGVRNVEVVI
ncbi:uncharacterized protein LOC135109749 isoform X2 [Scylla paramamosain]|uniref:uncharacterized protein LOC135109749 isoform X2 n=1 Tax=Scylla paramamosain TaxID=85552 RepID=UPI003083BD5F